MERGFPQMIETINELLLVFEKDVGGVFQTDKFAEVTPKIIVLNFFSGFFCPLK